MGALQFAQLISLLILFRRFDFRCKCTRDVPEVQLQTCVLTDRVVRYYRALYLRRLGDTSNSAGISMNEQEDGGTAIASTLAEIDVVQVDEATTQQWAHEGEHFSLAFDLFKETASYVCVLASVGVGDKQHWSIRQAVLGGHLVRMFKLMRFVMEETMHDRAELFVVLTRLLAECVINLRYLIQENSGELVDSYLAHSLQHERRLAEVIRKNIEARGNSELPIERRMLNSIDRTFKKSGIEESALPKKVDHWGGKNLFAKAKTVGLQDAYLAIFGGPSRNVHGGWQDLLQFHLKCDEPGLFSANLKFTAPRPQPLYSFTHLISETLISYAELLNHPDLTPIFMRVNDVHRRNLIASDLHEEFLVKRQAE